MSGTQRQNTGKARTRDSKGRWLPGHSPNPGGRPVRKNIADAIRDYLGEDKDSGVNRTRYLLEKLYKLATEKGDTQAAKILLSFGFGSPAQAVSLETRELPPEEERAEAFIDYLSEHPKTASSYKQYLLEKRQEAATLPGGNGNDPH